VRSPVPAFRFTGVIPLLWPRLSHSTPDTQFREGSSLQAGLYARTPVQSDCCALSGNYRLESNPERHDKSPLAAATGNWDIRERDSEVLKYGPDCGYTERTVWYCGLVYPVTWLSSSPTDLTFDQTTSQVVFSFSEQEITTETTGSQEDH
jgi:hypothetical protein